MIGKQKNAELHERRQQKLEAGLMSARYPGVASIVIAMKYYEKGHGSSLLQRTVNFFPGSAAYFLMDCLEGKCVDGGFDFDPIIYTMVKGHLESAKGELVCPGNDSPGHRRIDYKIAIRYC